MDTTKLESVRIRGFRSLAKVDLSNLPNAAVLIGANGSGKSNFIRFFEMLNAIGNRRLAEFVEKQGGADDQLHGGNRVTTQISTEIALRIERGKYRYRFVLSYAHPDGFFFGDEAYRFDFEFSPSETQWSTLGNGGREAIITHPMAAEQDPQTGEIDLLYFSPNILRFLRNCTAYQFHDTSDRSDFMKRWDAEDNARLQGNGSNLSAILYRLEREDMRRYELICRHIGRILPGFERFAIEESYGKTLLRWKAKWTDKTIGAHLTSDGSLRFFALVTLLNLPPEMLPDVILLDEPELGLHPAAVSLVGGMIKSLSVERQIIIATQSPLLVDTFDLDEIFVLDLKDGRTQIRKLNAQDYKVWLEDGYSTGQLWWKGIFGGYP